MWSGWALGNSNGPLVPMVRLVPMEKHCIPMVILVNMHLIKGTSIIFSCGLAGYRAIPIVHSYQWCTGTNGTIGTYRKAPYSNGSIGEYASH